MDARTLREWIRAELKARRLDYMHTKGRTAGVTSVAKFAKRAKISVEYVYKLERGESSPTAETLNDWLAACDVSLYEFFQKLISEAELSEVDKHSRDDAEVLRVLRKGMSYGPSRGMVVDTAGHVSEFLKLAEKQRAN